MDDERSLITTFTPAEYCTRYTYLVLDTTADCPDEPNCRYFHLGPEGDSDCMPSDWEAESTFYYSPGVCPDGYTQACSRTVESSGTTESRATCCPSDYSCLTGTTLPWFLTELCGLYIRSGSLVTYTTSTDGEDWETSTTSGTQIVHAFGVEIRWKSGDFASRTAMESETSEPAAMATWTAAATFSTETFSVKTFSTAISPSPTTQSETSSASGEITLPTSEMAGVGVGFGIGMAVGIIVTLIALAAIFFFTQRHKRPQLESAAPPEPRPSPPAAARSLTERVLPGVLRFPREPSEASTARSDVESRLGDDHELPAYPLPGWPDPSYR